MRNLKYFLLSALALVFLSSQPSIATAQDDGTLLFQTEQSAQAHCPADTVVWVNTKSGVYHFKGQHWYGTTNAGAYVCQKDGDKAGYRPTRNGQ